MKLMARLMFQKRMLKEVNYHHFGLEDMCTKYAQQLASSQMRRYYFYRPTDLY